MPTERRHEALITATTEQLTAVAAIVGDHNVKRLVMGENGVAAYYAEGPRILDQYADALPEAEGLRLKSWDELDSATQDSIVALAAGCHEWIEDPPRLEPEYLLDLLADNPELKEVLLHPAGNQPSTTE